MDELVAKELGKLTLTVIKQAAVIEALKAELAKRDAALPLAAHVEADAEK